MMECVCVHVHVRVYYFYVSAGQKRKLYRLIFYIWSQYHTAYQQRIHVQMNVIKMNHGLNYKTLLC